MQRIDFRRLRVGREHNVSSGYVCEIQHPLFLSLSHTHAHPDPFSHSLFILRLFIVYLKLHKRWDSAVAQEE